MADESSDIGGPDTLLDEGKIWQEVTDLCNQLHLGTAELTLSPADRWSLECDGPGAGSDQGQIALYTSIDEGRQWTLRARGGPDTPPVGNIG